MTLSSFPNNDSNPASIQLDMPQMQLGICEPVIVEPNNAVPVSPETTIEIPPSLKESFDKVYSGSDFLRREYSLMLEASKQILPTGESMPLDTYRRLYNLRFEKELPPYPEQWIWQQPDAWARWFTSLDKKHLGALLGKGGLLFAKWGAICTTVGSVLWATGHYVLTIPERQHQAHNQAWQIINSAKDSAANAGRVDALQALVKDKVSLAKLIAPKAYLAVSYDKKTNAYQGIKLPEADLWDADLSNAVLPNADLTKAILDSANLQKANLTNATLTQANLISADLTGAELPKAILTKANLTHADLTSANLKDANLTEANLSNADLRGADLRNANLTNAILKGILYDDKTLLPDNAKQKLDNDKTLKAVKIAPKAILAGAYLRGTNLRGANLTNADLTSANLMDIDLTAVNLTGAVLTGALYNLNTQLPENIKNEFQSKALKLAPNTNLTGANLANQDLRFIDMRGANLTEANLSSAILIRTNLTDANLTNANLKGVNLKDTQLTGAQLAGAKYNHETQFPEGFEPDKVGMQMEE